VVGECTEETDSQLVAEAQGEALGEGAGEALPLPLRDPEGVAVGLRDTLALAAGLRDAERLAHPVGVRRVEGEPLGVALRVRLGCTTLPFCPTARTKGAEAPPLHCSASPFTSGAPADHAERLAEGVTSSSAASRDHAPLPSSWAKAASAGPGAPGKGAPTAAISASVRCGGAVRVKEKGATAPARSRTRTPRGRPFATLPDIQPKVGVFIWEGSAQGPAAANR
jgi:hypothetical protein